MIAKHTFTVPVLAVCMFLALGTLVGFAADQMRKGTLPEADTGKPFVLNLVNGEISDVSDVDKAEKESYFRSVHTGGDIFYDNVKEGTFYISSHRVVRLDVNTLALVSSKRPSSLLVEKSVLEGISAGECVLLQTVSGRNVLLGILSKSDTSITLVWQTGPEGDKPFSKEQVNAVKAALTESHQGQAEPGTGVSEVVSMATENATTFSFVTKRASKVPPLPEEHSMESRRSHKAELLSRGDFLYEMKSGRAQLNVFSRQCVFLGIGRLTDFSGRDLSGAIKKNTALLLGLEEGSVILLKDMEEKYALVRIEEVTPQKLRFRWVYQPNGSALFPRVAPFPGERPYADSHLSQAQLDAKLLQLSAEAEGISQEAFNVSLKELIDSGADVNAVSFKGTRLLAQAALRGSLHVVRSLVEYGAEIDESRALINAAVMGHLHIIKYLLEQGADVNVTGPTGMTALGAALNSRTRNNDVVALLRSAGAGIDSLHLTAELGDMEMLRRMIDNKQDLNAIDSEGRTALHIAAEKGKSDVCIALLEAGAERTATLRGKRITPFMVASARANMDCVEAFLHAEPPPTVKERAQALTSAASGGHVDVCKAILQTGDNALEVVQASPELDCILRCATDEVIDVYAEVNFKVPLWAAARRGRIDLVRQALELGADIEQRCPVTDGEPALILAVMRGKRDVVEFLLKKGASAKVSTKEDVRTALHEAAVGNDAEIVQLLIDGGADVNALARDETPLFRAVRKGHQDIIKKLLDAGADPNRLPDKYSGKNGQSRVPLHRCTEDKAIQTLLKKHGSR